jgi:hypothetical protein
VAIRTAEKQSLHDRVVAEVSALVSNVSRTVTTNPGQEKNDSIGEGCWPDVVIRARQSGQLLFVCEVETEDSVTAAESAQWVKYAKRAPLTLVVPKPLRLDAAVYLAGADVTVRYLEYELKDGAMLFSESSA